eukprot:7245778-Prorocentrum_lima.AAC.1
MTSSLVGSEMCIRDSHKGACHKGQVVQPNQGSSFWLQQMLLTCALQHSVCLLYTSDAADDM